MSKLLAVIVLAACLIAVPAQAATPITPESAAGIQMLGVLKNEPMRTQSLVFTPHGNALVMSISLNDHNQIVWLDLLTQEEKILWENTDDAAEQLTFNGSMLVFYAGASVMTLDTTTGQVRTLYTAASNLEEVRSLASSPDGFQLAAGRREGSVIVMDAVTGAIQQSFATTDPAANDAARVQEEVNRVAFSPDGTQILSGHVSGWLRVWEIGSVEPVRAWQGHRTNLTDFTFSPDGTQLVTAGRDRHVIVWDWAAGTEIYNFSATASQVDFSPDGQLLAAGGKSLYLWDMQNGSLVYQNFHADSDVSAAKATFSPDGSFVVSGTRQVAFWGLESGILKLIPLEDDRVTAGEDLYRRNGCNGCHFEYPSGAPTLYGLGETAAARIEGVSGEDYIYQSIVDPDAYVVKGFPRGIHPTSYRDRLSQEEIWMLVAYIKSLKPR